MKTLLSILALALSLNSFAHTTQALTKATNSKVEALKIVSSNMSEAMDKRYENIGGGTVFNAYKITKLSPTRKAGEAEGAFAERLVKSILHRDYPITGDDGGYSFDQIKFGSEVEAKKYLNNSMEWISGADEAEAFLADFIKGILKLSQDSSVIVLNGNGSGNNTMASIFAVVDLKNNELFYIVDSNFGSDD